MMMALPPDFAFMLRSAIPIVAITGGCVITLAVVAPFAKALARRLEPDNRQVAGGDAELRTRLERIEVAVESIAIEVERISEAQRYSARLLAERDDRALPPSSRS